MRWLSLFALGSVLFARPAGAHPGYLADVARLTQQLDVAPTADLFLRRAERYRLLAQWENAASDLAAAERLGASPVQVALERGQTLAAAGDTAQALAELDRYLALGGASAAGLRAHARLHASAGRYDAAALDLARVLAAGADPEVCLELADVELARRRTEDAARMLERCLQQLGGAVVVRKKLIDVRLLQHDHAAAAAVARAAMPGLSVKAEWRLIAADALTRAGSRAEARQELEAALAELDGVLAGRRAGGLHQLLRARALAGLGRKKEALAQLDALLAAQQNFEEAKALRAQLAAPARKGRKP
jgi:tetratricopeptide (TPR) repeat protein